MLLLWVVFFGGIALIAAILDIATAGDSGRREVDRKYAADRLEREEAYRSMLWRMRSNHYSSYTNTDQNSNPSRNKNKIRRKEQKNQKK